MSGSAVLAGDAYGSRGQAYQQPHISRPSGGYPALPGCCSPVGLDPGYSYPVPPDYGPVGGPNDDSPDTSPDTAGQQQGAAGGANFNQNDPAAVLARFDDLSLTDDQVRRLEKMVKSGSKHAGLLLTKEQKKKLRELAGIRDKSPAVNRLQPSGD
ncbi:MAG: hypothetical protein ABSG86_01765 [Thermoguttaceae bacterium]|jgi:hypothetical protein